ncbi:MAG: MATE family efflux transporter [Ruminococcaceae bacterium]|nr:MATE family efflux transporter [Oscillospiraceae bacterium]
MRRRFIGDRRFYGRMFAVLLPIVIQNFITNFVSLLDNIMVGQVGTVQMSGVAIVNQLLFIFNLCIFGGMSGAGIFTAQFCGSGDHEGIRHTFRYKIVLGILLSALGGVLLFLFRGELISLFLQGDGDPAAAAASLAFGCDYLRIMLLGLLPFALTNAYSSTLRENGQTVVPMVAGIGAVTVNLVLNYVLIFGHLGAPTLGTDGAAIATVISRYVELAVVALYTHLHGREFPFIKGAFGSLYIPKRLLRSLILKGIPLLLSETLWSVGMTTLTQSYSIRGLDVVAALNIANTVINLSGVVYIAMGSTVGIIVGQLLGTGACEEEVRDTDRKLIFAAILSSIVFGGLLASVSAVFPRIYNTTDAVRGIATGLILISAAIMPFNSFTHCIYFTLRSGGCTGITFLYDNCYMWGVVVTTAFFLSRFSPLTIIPLYAICQSLDILKGALGILFLKSNMWIKRLAVPTDE